MPFAFLINCGPVWTLPISLFILTAASAPYCLSPLELALFLGFAGENAWKISWTVHQTSTHLVSEITATVFFSCFGLCLLCWPKCFHAGLRREVSHSCRRNQMFSFGLVCFVIVVLLVFTFIFFFALWTKLFVLIFFSSTNLLLLFFPHSFKELSSYLTLQSLISTWMDCLWPTPAPYSTVHFVLYSFIWHGNMGMQGNGCD